MKYHNWLHQALNVYIWSRIAQLVRAWHHWGFPSWDMTPGSRVQSQAEATWHCVNWFQYPVRLTSVTDETLKPRSLVPEIVYMASQISHGILLNPGIQVGCQCKLTWSYMQSTSHTTPEALLALTSQTLPLERALVFSRLSYRQFGAT